MGCCTGRCLLITICVLQLIATIERQVFDFLGYMWAPIIGNFLQIIFIIIGFFGALQYRPKVVIAYVVWSLVWIGWNIFVICFYLEVGLLRRDSSFLNIGTGNKSWWFDNGIGCQVANQTLLGDGNTSRESVPPDMLVEGCLLQYYYVEIIHAGVQCLLSLLGFCVACYVIYVFTEEDDSSQPVHDELEYIKMRYRSPARSSFRDQKAYETLTTRSTYTSSMERTSENQDYSDNSAEHLAPKKHCNHNKKHGSGKGKHQHHHHNHQQQQQHRHQVSPPPPSSITNDSPHTTTTELPWTSLETSPSQPPRQTDLGGGGDYIDRYGNEGFPPPPPPLDLHQDLGDPYSSYRYNLHGPVTQGATVI